MKDSGKPPETTPSRSSTRSKRASGPKVQQGPATGSSTSIDSYLAEAKARRDQAETLRRSVAQGILDATTELYQQLLADGEKSLENAKLLESQAEQKLKEAAAVRAEADAYLEKSRDAASEQARDILARARSDARQESAKIKEQAELEGDVYLQKARVAASEQARDILTRARAKAEEESAEVKKRASLEAQRIYAEASRLEADYRELLAQARAKLEAGDEGTEDGGDRRNYDSSGLDTVPHSPPEDPVNYHPSLLADDVVLGLALGSSAKAYPYQTIVSNGVVNDALAAHPVLVVCAPFTEPEVIFTRQHAGRVLTFKLVPDTGDAMMWMQDLETGSIWQALTGTAIGGPLAGSVLGTLPSRCYLWAVWRELHPNTEVYVEE